MRQLPTAAGNSEGCCVYVNNRLRLSKAAFPLYRITFHSVSDRRPVPTYKVSIGVIYVPDSSSQRSACDSGTLHTGLLKNAIRYNGNRYGTIALTS